MEKLLHICGRKGPIQLEIYTCINISLAVVAHTATKPVGKRRLMPNLVEIGLGRWRSLDHEGWALLVLTSAVRKSASIPAAGPRS
jgi:hypothetical protein